jgi:nucleotide-binding universal stress UspA family protein
MNFEKILVPLDGSPLAEAALARAAALAKRDDAALRLLRAVEASPLLGIDPAQRQVEIVREAEEYLASVAARLGKDGVKKVETSVWYGPAASSIVEAVHLHKADLIVMSTHGRGGLGRLILGSVAESVLRGTTVPILLLRAQGAAVEAAPGAGRARPMPKPSRA